jgi:peptidyl-prolyl cis-trans isomerase D
MSIIQKIREKYAAVSISVIALSLVGFILTDYFTSRSGSTSSSSTDLGEVNGTSIDVNGFNERVAEYENGYRQQGMDVNDDLRQQIIDMLWNNEVEEIVLNKEYKKLGLTFSAAELNDALYGSNPPPALAQQFKNEQTGAYDPAAARQFINSMRKKKANDPQRLYVERNIIDYIISNGLRSKYNALLAGSAFYPKWLSDKDLNDQNSIASINYVAIPYTTISDSSVKVTDEDIAAYIRKHKNEFKQEESRTISYVTFDAAPTTADSALSKEDVAKSKQAFLESTDPAQFINANNSAIAYYDGFVVKSGMKMSFADSIQNLPLGAVAGPYLDGTNYTMAKMIEKRQMPDSVKCRHILIGTKDPQTGQVLTTDSLAKAKADSIAGAIAKGADFKILAAQFSTDQGSKDNGGEYEFTSQQTNLAKEFAEFVFFSPKGSKKVVKTDFGYHYIEVLDQKKFEPAFKVAYYSKTITASDETINTASTSAAQFAAECRNAKQFEETSRNKKLSPRIAEVKPTEYNILGLGSARRLVKWIFENKAGTVSEPENLGDKYIVAIISEEKEEGVADVKSVRPQVEVLVRSIKKANEIIAKIGNNRDLNAIATSFKTTVLRADSVSFVSPFIPGIGMEPKISGAAFNPQIKGKAGDPIAGSTGVFIIKNESIGLKPAANLDYNNLRMQMEQGLKQNMANNSIQALKKAAKINDNRIKFF